MHLPIKVMHRNLNNNKSTRCKAFSCLNYSLLLRCAVLQLLRVPSVSLWPVSWNLRSWLYGMLKKVVELVSYFLPLRMSLTIKRDVGLSVGISCKTVEMHCWFKNYVVLTLTIIKLLLYDQLIHMMFHHDSRIQTTKKIITN